MICADQRSLLEDEHGLLLVAGAEAPHAIVRAREATAATPTALTPPTDVAMLMTFLLT
jgi:hypothetical protein